jgi:hypothetical protein
MEFVNHQGLGEGFMDYSSCLSRLAFLTRELPIFLDNSMGFAEDLELNHKLALFIVSKGRQKLKIPASIYSEAETKIGVSEYPT